jgi:hypothetical protein
MTNALVVLNLNDFMPAIARESMTAAAARWGVEYVEVTEPVADVHHFWQKTYLPLTLTRFERVAVFDADILIRSDCPSLFEKVPPEYIGCVSDVQMGYPRNWRHAYMGLEEAKRFGLKPYPTERDHLNGGMVVYEPVNHAYYLNEWRKAGERANWSIEPLADEGALSCVLHHFHAPVWWLPWRFNALVQYNRRHTPMNRMNAFIYHFYLERERKQAGKLGEVMSQVNWRVE